MVIGKTDLSSTISLCILFAALVIVEPLSAMKTKDEDPHRILPPAPLSMRRVPPGDRELFSVEALNDFCFNFCVLLLLPVVGKGPEDIKKECENKVK